MHRPNYYLFYPVSVKVLFRHIFPQLVQGGPAWFAQLSPKREQVPVVALRRQDLPGEIVAETLGIALGLLRLLVGEREVVDRVVLIRNDEVLTFVVFVNLGRSKLYI